MLAVCVSAGGRGGGKGRVKVGGDYPLAAIARAVVPEAPRRAREAAAPAVGRTTTAGRGADDDATAAAADAAAAAAPARRMTAAAARAGREATAADGAAGVAPVATAAAAARTVLTMGGSCCFGYEEYKPYHTHPCCLSGCRITAEYLPFITLDMCCNYQHQRNSTGEWFFINREGRYC